MSGDTLNADEVRAHAQRIVERAKEDGAFAERLKADPEGTLREAGFEEQAIPDFTREVSDVEAHRPCEPLTCVVTCTLISKW